MISIPTYIISIVIASVIGAVIGIFVYRNNVKTIGKVADKADAINDVIKG